MLYVCKNQGDQSVLLLFQLPSWKSCKFLSVMWNLVCDWFQVQILEKNIWPELKK